EEGNNFHSWWCRPPAWMAPQNSPYQRRKAPHRRWGSVGSCRPSRPQGHPPAPPEGVKNSKPVGNGGGRGSRRASLVDKFRESRLARRLSPSQFLSHLPFEGGMGSIFRLCGAEILHPLKTPGFTRNRLSLKA